MFPCAVYLRGHVTDVSDRRTVETTYGSRDLIEVGLRTPDDNYRVGIWGDWCESAELLSPGMSLAVTAVSQRDGDHQQVGTTSDSFVVVAPDYLVDVTDIRSWVQCPRMEYLNKLSGVPLAEPVTKGTIVHEVFADLLAGRELSEAVDDSVQTAALELDLLGVDRAAIRTEVTDHATAIQHWLEQGQLTGTDAWQAEQTLLSPVFGMKGRVDAIRRGMPVELKTGKNTNRDPRFHDKIQAASYALLLGEQSAESVDEIASTAPDTGTLLYTKNAAVDRAAADGDLSPAKEFSIGKGLLDYVVQERNALAAMAVDQSIPTGYEGDAICDYCFEQDTCLVISGRLDQESKAGQLGDALPTDAREYFDRWYQRLEAERRAIHTEYQKLWEQTPAERREADRALINLTPTAQTQRQDGRWELTAARPTRTTTKLREGDTVLASDGDPVYGDTARARIITLTADQVTVLTDEDITLQRIDVYPSEFSVDRMLTALHDGILQQDDRFRDLLLGNTTPTFDPPQATYIENNDAQNEAVRTAVGADDLALIHGPPGTGKTYVIAHIAAALIDQGDRVLLSAFTNRAVDNAVAAIRSQGVADIVRLGSEPGVRGDMQDIRLHTDSDDAATTLQETPLIAATTAACGSRTMRAQSVDVAIIDEASQLTEPDALTALARADRYILVGDHEQLPPVVHTDDIDQSLFRRLIETYPGATVFLDRQYRMGQRIQAFPSQEFYDGALRPATATIAERSPETLTSASSLPEKLHNPVTFHHIDGDDNAQTDIAEAEYITTIIDDYRDAGIDPDGIGVIAPYRAQVSTLTDRLPDAVTVDTVDRFQGSAANIIIVSFVTSTDLETPLFEDTRRLNVALTRAKHGLVLVGDETALRTHPTYARMLDWATHIHDT